MSIGWRVPYNYALAGAIVAAMLAGAIIGGLALSTPPLTALVVILAVLGSVATLRNPFVGLASFVIVATLLPFAVLPIRIVFAPTLIDLAVSFTLVACLARATYQHNAVSFGWTATLLLAFVVIALAAFLLGGSVAPVGADRTRLFLKLLNSVLLFITTIQIVRTQLQLARLVQLLIIGGASAALLAIVLHELPPSVTFQVLSALGGIGYPTSELLRPIAGTETLRATGTSVDPNVLGGTLAVVAAVAIVQMLAPVPVLSRRLLVVAAALCVAGLILTYSRSALLGLLAATIFLAGFRTRSAIVPLAAGAATLLLIPQGQLSLGRLISGFGAQDPAAAMRLGEYQNAISIIAQYPALGIGFGESPRPDVGLGVSNLYLLVAEQTGLIGFSLFAASLITIAVVGFGHDPRLTGQLSGVRTGLQAAFVAMLAAGMFDHYFFNARFPHMVGLFWLVAGLLVASSQLQSADGENLGQRLRVPTSPL